jgi:hypothetical protein
MTHSQHRRPFWLGILLAPWAAPAVSMLVVSVEHFTLAGPADPTGLLATAVFVFMFGVPIGYAAMVLLGLPYALWLRATGRLTYAWICAGSALAGAIAFTAVGIADKGADNVSIKAILLGAVFGVIAGASFGVAVGPNSSSKPTPLRGAA